MNLDTLIRDSDPTRHAPVARADSIEAGLLFEKIVDIARRQGPATRSRRRRRRLVIVAPIVASVVAGVVAGTIVLTSKGAVLVPPGKRPPARAAALLDSAAGEAAGQSALPTLGPGQYYYEKTVLFGRCLPYDAGGRINQTTGAPLDPALQNVVYLQSVTVETWTAADGSGTHHETYSGHFQDPQDQALWQASGAPNDCALPAQPVTTIPPRSAQDPGISMLPSDPTAIATLIAAGRVNDVGQVSPSTGLCPSQAGPSTQVFANGEVCNVAAQFDIVTNLLENPGAPIKLGPVLYQVLAKLPSVKAIGNQTDAIGRTGVAIEDPNSGDVFVIDTSTGTLLESETIATTQSLASGETSSGIAPGTVLDTTTYAVFGVTDSIGSVPSNG
jgi:hypothetical protein